MMVDWKLTNAVLLDDNTLILAMYVPDHPLEECSRCGIRVGDGYRIGVIRQGVAARLDAWCCSLDCAGRAVEVMETAHDD